MKLINFLLICFFMIFSSCKISGQEDNVNIRVAVVSLDNQSVEMNVFVENGNGQIATGAIVMVKNTENQIIYLPFDSKKWCHTANLSISSDGFFDIYVDTILSDFKESIKVPIELIKEVPIITAIQDSIGNSVFLGENLDRTKDIQITWKGCGDNVIYCVSVNNTMETEFFTSTEQTQIIIPKETLEKCKTYYVEVKAQKIQGDPLFQEANFYSLSSKTSSQVGFFLE